MYSIIVHSHGKLVVHCPRSLPKGDNAQQQSILELLWVLKAVWSVSLTEKASHVALDAEEVVDEIRSIWIP